jgi:hypothetical protein
MLFSAAAIAAPLLHAGPEPARLASRLASQEDTTILARRPEELLQAAAPRLVDGGRAVICGSEPTGGDELSAMVEEANQALAYMEWETASLELEAASQALACLGTEVDPALAARLHFLQGVVAQRRGAEPLAREAFRRALFFDPELAWDPAVSPKAKDLFDEERVRPLEPSVSVLVVGPSELHLDGHVVTLQDHRLLLVPGDHLIQADGATLTVHVDEGDAPTLVLPASLQDAEVVGWSDSEGGREVLAALFAYVGDPVGYVATMSSVWRWDGDWTRLGAPTDIAPERGDPRLALGGAALVVAGGTTAAIGFAQAAGAYEAAADVRTLDDFGVVATDYDRSVAVMRTGKWVAVGGAALTAAGVGVYMNDVSITPMGLTVVW